MPEMGHWECLMPALGMVEIDLHTLTRYPLTARCGAHSTISCAMNSASGLI